MRAFNCEVDRYYLHRLTELEISRRPGFGHAILKVHQDLLNEKLVSLKAEKRDQNGKRKRRK